jgi:hypothetical protein
VARNALALCDPGRKLLVHFVESPAEQQRLVASLSQAAAKHWSPAIRSAAETVFAKYRRMLDAQTSASGTQTADSSPVSPPEGDTATATASHGGSSVSSGSSSSVGALTSRSVSPAPAPAGPGAALVAPSRPLSKRRSSSDLLLSI